VDVFALIAERRIREAMEEGAFENLQGRGKPLDFSDDRRVPRELRSIYRVLKNAGALPPELELRREIRRLEDLLPKIQNEDELREAVRSINGKIAALNLMGLNSGRTTIKNEMAQIYAEKLVERLREGT
jgi:hypothetical protein